MVAAVVESYLDVHQREAGQDAQLQCSLHTLIDGLDELPRHRATLDFVDELITRARQVGLDAQLAMPVVA